MSLFSGKRGGREPEGDRARAREPGATGSVSQRTESAARPADPSGDEREGAGRRSRRALARGERGAASSGGNREGQGGDVAHIGTSIIFKGDLTGDEDLEIDGRVEGQIQLPNHQLTIGAHGRVKAQVEAKTVIVVGHVSGNVNATERVEVQAAGVVDGDIRAPRLLIQEGAVVNGSVEMGERAAAPKEGGKPTPAEPAAAAGGGGGRPS